MNIHLRILLVVFSILLTIIIFKLISKNKLPIKYSLFWLFSALVIFLVSLFPNFINIFTKLIGFETTSNFIIGIILGLLLIITLLLTIIIADQKRRLKLLVQEVSILKKNHNK
ncbi:MAG: DUF2304 domain-containing protein [Bacilli bacterium]|nr:DUF2304 domain-containing protein [Bacilli bacterium]